MAELHTCTSLLTAECRSPLAALSTGLAAVDRLRGNAWATPTCLLQSLSPPNQRQQHRFAEWLVWRGRFPPAASDERDRLAARHAWLEEAAFGAETVAQALTCVCEPRLGDLGPGQRLATRLWTGPELRGEVRGAQRLVSGALRTPLGTEAVRGAAPDVLSKLEEMELAYAQLDDRGGLASSEDDE